MKNKNNIIIITITTVVLWFVGFKGTIFVFNNPDFHYNGLPLWGVYCILAMYLVIDVMVTVLAVMKFIKHGKYGK